MGSFSRSASPATTGIPVVGALASAPETKPRWAMLTFPRRDGAKLSPRANGKGVKPEISDSRLEVGIPGFEVGERMKFPQRVEDSDFEVFLLRRAQHGRWIPKSHSSEPKRPNQAPEPTTMAVTLRAPSGIFEMKSWNQDPNPARSAPAMVVAHL